MTCSSLNQTHLNKPIKVFKIQVVFSRVGAKLCRTTLQPGELLKPDIYLVKVRTEVEMCVIDV